jgi:hypothetical protein
MRIQGETRTQHGQLDHTPEAVDGFISSLAIRFPGQRVAVALEQSLRYDLRNAVLCRHSTSRGESRQAEMDTLALRLSEVLAPKVSRMGLAVHTAIGLGEELLRPATRTKKVAPRRHTSPGVKWIRILFRCWKDSVPYDATRYAAALQKCGPEKPEEIHMSLVSLNRLAFLLDIVTQ